jgi:hypothetical protein
METLQRTANRGSISTGYEIENSLKLEPDNSELLNITNTSAGNRRTATYSFWLKRTELDASGFMQVAGLSTTSETVRFMFYQDHIMLENGNGGTRKRLTTNAVYRDTSAFYHFVVAIDTTQSTAANRVKLYVNGVQETSFSTEEYPDQNFDLAIGQSGSNFPWRYGAYDTTYYKTAGYFAEAHYIDGTQYAASDFGEFDEDSGIWKPKEFTGNYGTQGSYLNFSDASNLGANPKGSDIDAVLTNITAADQATDTPTNNFTTWNTIRLFNSGVISFKEGGTVLSNSFNGGWSAANNNIRMGKGKWYAEFEVTVSGNYLMNGNVDADYIDNSTSAGFYLGSLTDKTAGAGYYSSGTTGNDTIYYEQTFTSSGVTTSAGDIISVAIDCDNNKVHFAVNGSWTNSSDPATNTNGFAMTDNEQYFALASIGVRDYKANFGGYTTISISSAASDANGYGTFEYAPPSGYYALCTKNLAEYG